mmetsp:Transcript_7122/g.16175  ORF Transcript_7122/g.16175 Transcript_7122/m.16175 type:complete len:215 (-) Transcript_7122:255-899(-)
MAPSTKAAKAARRCPKPSLGSYSLGRQSVAPRCRYTPPPKARIKPMVASSTCAESTMAVPMSTLVPLMKFAAKAFAMPKATSGPVKITKSATSWGSSCRMVPTITLQPKEFPQPLKAAPMKKPSQRLWKKSPMTTAPTSRAVALNLATGSSVSAFPASTEDSSPEGEAADPPLTASMMILQIVSTTGGKTRPAKIMVPQRQTTSTSALHPTATR